MSYKEDKNKQDNLLDDLSSGEIKSVLTYAGQNNEENNLSKIDNSNISNNNSHTCEICKDKDKKTNNKNDQHFIQNLINNLNINQNKNSGDVISKDLSTSKETEISFMIDEEEKNDPEICKIKLIKKNGENVTKFKFNFIFSIDTIQGVVNELAKVVTLTNDEIKQCETKLKIFIREQKQKMKEKQDIDDQINLINNCYDLFIKEYNDNLKQIQDLTHLYQEIKENSIDYTKEEIEDIDNKMKILSQLK